MKPVFAICLCAVLLAASVPFVVADEAKADEDLNFGDLSADGERLAETCVPGVLVASLAFG